MENWLNVASRYFVASVHYVFVSVVFSCQPLPSSFIFTKMETSVKKFLFFFFLSGEQCRHSVLASPQNINSDLAISGLAQWKLQSKFKERPNQTREVQAVLDWKTANQCHFDSRANKYGWISTFLALWDLSSLLRIGYKMLTSLEEQNFIIIQTSSAFLAPWMLLHMLSLWGPPSYFNLLYNAALSSESHVTCEERWVLNYNQNDQDSGLISTNLPPPGTSKSRYSTRRRRP